MTRRIRHCVECPSCHTLYLASRSPYRNGSYIVPTGGAASEEFTLKCYCSGSHIAHSWKWLTPIPCEVSRTAHDRGYGSVDEVLPIARKPQMDSLPDLSRDLDFRQT